MADFIIIKIRASDTKAMQTLQKLLILAAAVSAQNLDDATDAVNNAADEVNNVNVDDLQDQANDLLDNDDV